jgi:hypothetical protein
MLRKQLSLTPPLFAPELGVVSGDSFTDDMEADRGGGRVGSRSAFRGSVMVPDTVGVSVFLPLREFRAPEWVPKRASTYWALSSPPSVLLFLGNGASERARFMIAKEAVGRLPLADFRAC